MKRLALVVVALALACKSGAPPPVEEDAAPRGLGALDGATKITLRDVTGVAGSEHDLVLELVRDGAEVAWTAKLTDRAFTFGEPSPIASVGTGDAGATCTCAVKDSCACEGTGAEVLRKSGRIPVATFDALLAAWSKATFGPSALDGAGRDERAHATITLAAGSEPIHVVREASGRPWRSAGRALDQRPEIEMAWMRVLDAVGARGWVAALHPLPIVLAPKELAAVAKADRLELDHVSAPRADRSGAALQIVLERAGKSFAWHGKSGTATPVLFSAVPDRRVTHLLPQCFCPVDEASCCGATLEKRAGTVPSALVDALLADLAQHTLGTGTLGGFSPGAHDESHLAVMLDGTTLHFTRTTAWALEGRALAEPKTPSSLDEKWSALVRALSAP